MRNIYRTDGSERGFLTAVFDAYPDKDAYLTSAPFFQAELFDGVRLVETDEETEASVEEKEELNRKLELQEEVVESEHAEEFEEKLSQSIYRK